MATPREYNGLTYFRFKCDECDVFTPIGLEELDKTPVHRCLVCGAPIKVPNGSQLVVAANRAEAAFQTLHEEMDDCPTFNEMFAFGGEVHLLKVTWD